MIDLKSLFPSVTAFIAFILILCCIFAGTQKNLLNNADLFTLYTPQAGYESAACDFYSIHVMSYCQGIVGVVEPGASAITRNVTGCSNRNILFSFDPTQAWPDQVSHGPTLSWPRVLSDDFTAFRITTQSMGVFYCLGVSAVGVALVVRAASFFTPSPQHGLFESGFLMLGWFSITISSIIASIIAFEFVGLINAHGDGSNVSAKYGERFLGMTWASAALLLLGSIVSFVNLSRGTESAAPLHKDEEEG
ncbi:hypothetical protein N7495_000237 [Penicillium taxi]|uniref:uncharacterized protein n=1 Tax=Penicillium taxi TaxID=168475 RepID=UPI0025455E4F|nr:uncharacterized protein N7495_000237 [Penicillium taxi]KAJ5907555.1 hypothetical protein N7495_000237 [Penicillium taxi]